MLNKKLKKVIASVTMFASVVCLSGVSMLAPLSVKAADVIADGDLISSNAKNSDGTPTYASLDVYIVKVVGTKKFKRLILNPTVFNSYDHLKGKTVQEVDQSVVDGYTTSSLARVDGNDKVYALTPNDDAGAKSWINLTAAEFLGLSQSDPDSIYTINSTDGSSYSAKTDITTVAQLTAFYADGTLPADVAGDALKVALSADTPASVTVPSSSTGVVFTKVNLTAPSTGDVVVNEMTISRSGVGAYNDLSAVYIYDGSTRLTNARSISSDTNSTDFTGLNITVSAGQTKTLSLVANVGVAKSGHQALGITAIKTASSATISGLPVTGNEMALSTTAVGTVTVVKTGSLVNPVVGDTGVDLASFKLTAGTEDSYFNSISLKQDGTISTDLLSNFKLAQGTTDVPITSSVSGRYVNIKLSTPMKLVNGASKSFTLSGDVSSSTEVGKTIVFFVYNTADVLVKSSSYGYGVVPDISGYDAAADSQTLTVQGGGLTIANNSASASDAKTNSTGVELMRVKLTANADAMTVSKMTLGLATTPSGDYGTYKDVNGNTNQDSGDTALISNIKIKDAETGATVGASKAITDASNYAIDNDVNVALNFTYNDEFNIAKGTARTLIVVADISSSQISNVVYKASLDFSSTGFTVKDSQDNAVTDIVPNTVITGNNITTQTSSLTVSRASSPESVTVVKGGTVDALGMIFKAGSGAGNDVKISGITLDAYVDANVDGTFALKTETETVATPASSLISQVSLYVGDTLIAGPVSINTDGKAVFSSSKFVGGSYSIPAGSSQTILVKTVTSGTAPYGGAEDAFSFTLDSADITAQDDNGSIDATVTDTDVNHTTAPLVAIRITGNGTIASAIDSSRPDAQIVAAGTAGQIVSKIKLTAAKEAFVADKLTVAINEAGSYDDINTIQLQYGTTTSSAVGLDSAGKATFSGLTIDVPKVGGTIVTVIANLNTVGERTNALVGTAGVGADSGDAITFSLSTVSGEFHAVGSSSSVVDGDADAAVSQTMILRKSKPTVALQTNSQVLGSTVMDLLKFSVSADAKGDISLKGIKPTMTLNDADAVTHALAITAGTVYLYDITNGETQLNTAGVDKNTMIEIDDAKMVTISAGQTRNFVIRGTVALSASGDSIVTKIAQDTGALSAGTETATGGNVATNAIYDAQNSFIWSDRSGDTNGVSSTEWTNSYKLINWPSSQSISR